MMTMINTPKTRGKLLFDMSLSRYNTWGVGGNAQCVFHPEDIEDLSHFLANTDADIPLTWLGLGSNVLIRDGGIEGIVIVTQTGQFSLHVIQTRLVWIVNRLDVYEHQHGICARHRQCVTLGQSAAVHWIHMSHSIDRMNTAWIGVCKTVRER